MGPDIKIKIFELYNLLDNIGWDISDTRQSLEDLEMNIRKKNEKSIKDIENLKRELKRDGLYSEKLEEFLDNYMKYYNN